MNSKTSTSSNERMKMNSSAQKTTRTVDRIKDRQTGSDTYKGRPRRWSLEPKLKDKKKEIKEVWGAVAKVAMGAPGLDAMRARAAEHKAKRGIKKGEYKIDEGNGYQPEIEHSKLGDATKKAKKEKESKLPPHLQGDAIGKMKKAFASTNKESFYNWRSELLGEEDYDKMKDARLVKYGIGHDGSDRKGPSSPPPKSKVKGKTVLQKETEKKYGKGVSAIDVVTAKIRDKYGKDAIMKPKK